MGIMNTAWYKIIFIDYLLTVLVEYWLFSLCFLCYSTMTYRFRNLVYHQMSHLHCRPHKKGIKESTCKDQALVSSRGLATGFRIESLTGNPNLQ
jgi:hypothetical protein